MRLSLFFWAFLAVGYAGWAQGLPFDGSFESQAQGSFMSGEWVEGGGQASYIATSTTAPTVPSVAGFPTSGSRFLVLDPTGVGATVFPCEGFPNASAAWVQSSAFGLCATVTSITFDWSWWNAESTDNPIFNDWFAVWLRRADGSHIATLLYVDTHTGLASGLNPTCPSGAAVLPRSFSPVGEVLPAGPKMTTINIGSLAGYQAGSEVYLILACGNRGDGFRTSIAVMDNIVLNFIPSPVSGQANSADATLLVNGLGATCPGPFNVSVPSGGLLTFSWQGPPNQPLILLAGPLNPINFNTGCSGLVDLGTFPTYADVVIVMNGTSAGFPSVLYRTGQFGTAEQSFSIPILPSGPLLSVQGLLFQPPNAPCSAVLTAAFSLSIT